MQQAQKRGLARLMLRWPAHRAELKRRAADDPRFAELCEAYETACAAVEFWTRSPAAVALERVDEYRALASDTEGDILVRIS